MYIANLMVIISSICTVIALVLSWRTISAISRLIKAGDKENGRLLCKRLLKSNIFCICGIFCISLFHSMVSQQDIIFSHRLFGSIIDVLFPTVILAYITWFFWKKFSDK